VCNGGRAPGSIVNELARLQQQSQSNFQFCDERQRERKSPLFFIFNILLGPLALLKMEAKTKEKRKQKQK